MSDWEQPEPKWLVPELGEEYRALPFEPEPSAGEIMAGSSVMDRLDQAKLDVLREIFGFQPTWRDTEIGDE